MSKSRTKVRAARAARLFFIIQPIRFLFSGVVVVVNVVLASAPQCENFMSSFGRLRQKIALKSVPHEQHDYFPHSTNHIIDL